MDAVDKLVVRFHFNGEFLFDGKNTCYVNGREALSYIDRKKVSLNEIRGQAKEHYEVAEKALFHWCFPRKSIADRLRVLHDDKTCLLMAKYTIQGVVADVYVELVDIEEIDAEANKDEVGSDFEDEMKEISDNNDLDDNTVELIGGNEVIMINSSPTHVNKNDMCGGKRKVFKTSSVGTKSNGDSSSDSEYLPGDSSSSGDDEEADEIEKTFKEFKRKFKAGHVSELDEITWAGGAEPSRGIVPYVVEEGHETPYYDSSDDEASFDEQGSSGELVRHESKYPRFRNNNSSTSPFSLGMKFSSKKEFKDAVIQYALAERRVINFTKDESHRVRAKCDWATCPWYCLLSLTTRSESWQINSFTAEHTCPQRKKTSLSLQEELLRSMRT